MTVRSSNLGNRKNTFIFMSNAIFDFFRRRSYTEYPLTMLSNTFQSSERGKRERFERKYKFEINVNLT